MRCSLQIREIKLKNQDKKEIKNQDERKEIKIFEKHKRPCMVY